MSKLAQDSDSKKVAAPLRQLAQTSKTSAQRNSDTDLAPETDALALDIGKMIEAARAEVAQTANAALTTLYWQIGIRIRQDILKAQRAEYGAEIVATLGRQLEAQFGRGFGAKSLRHILRFAQAFPDLGIVSALRRQLSWTHFKRVELYLRWLDRYERQLGEEAPLAIILCAGKKEETVETLDLGKSGIHVAET